MRANKMRWMQNKKRAERPRTNPVQKQGTLLLAFVAASACGDPEVQRPTGTLDLETKRPELMDAPGVPPYSGSNAVVLEASSRLTTGLDLHKNVIIRTCGPTAGVCHNQKEYPDLHTASNLVNAISAPCNVQPGDWSAVFDGCEQPGHTFSFSGEKKRVEVAYIDYIPGEPDFGEQDPPSNESPGLHIYLAEALSAGDWNRRWDSGNFTGKFVTEDGKVKESTYADYDTEWWYLDGGRHIVGAVNEWQVEYVERLLAQGIVQGDMNRNGIFGARDSSPLHMLEAGDPERSYLIGRVRGELKGQKIPGTRMPLANQPLSVAEMLALYCFIEGLPSELIGEFDMLAPINYEECSWAENPEDLNLLGDNVTWLGFVKPLLEANCGGCHGGEKPQGNFDIMSEGAYERLLGASVQVPEMPLVTPGSLENSYLWVKLTGGTGMVGQIMPVDSDNLPRPLSQPLLDDVATWITNGAAANE